MGKQCWSQAVLESGSWGHSVLQTPALFKLFIQGRQLLQLPVQEVFRYNKTWPFL